MNSNLQSILEPQEKIIWQGNVSRKVLSFNLTLWLLIIIAFSIFLFSSSESSNFISYLLFFVLLITVVIKFLTDYVKVFIITDKRIIIRSGIIGTDYNSIFFTEIKTTNVQVDLIEKIFGVGSINIDTGKIETVTDGKNNATKTAYDKLSYINKPYEVYKILQSTLSNRQESLYSGRADSK